MNIYFILPDLSAGGAERVSITIARILKKCGHEVRFLNLGSHEGDMVSWIEPEFEMISFNKRRTLCALPELRLFMKTHRESIFFSSREHVNMIGLLAAKMTGSPMIVRIPNMPRNKLTKGLSGFKMRIIKAINRCLLPSAKMIIAQNEEMRNQVLEYYSLASNKVVAISNPVDKDYVIASAKGSINPYDKYDINFLSVCNIAYSKGIDILIESWKKVKAVIPNAHMYIIGRNNSEYARQLMDSVKDKEHFTFLGFQSNPYPYLKHCDVFVLPSRMEGFPNVVLEAMCFNRPIASTSCVDVVKKIINQGLNGYFCEIENAEALADCMIKASSLKDIKNQYGMFDLEKLLNVFS